MIIATLEPDVFEAALGDRLAAEGFTLPDDNIVISVCMSAKNRGKRYCETIGGIVGLRSKDGSEVRTEETVALSPVGVSIDLTLYRHSPACETKAQ